MKIENVNRNKFHEELVNADIKTIYVGALNDTEIGCEIIFADYTDMTAVQAVIDAHNPEPLPLQPTEIEKLRLEQAKSNAEMIDLMMAMLGGM